MTLRFRLGLLVALLTLIGLLLFGTLAYGLFVRQQQGQLIALLGRDLDRVAELFANPVLGARFVNADEETFNLQVVAANGQVILPRPTKGPVETLPLYLEPTFEQSSSGVRLLGSRPWLAGGSIRLALDVSDAFAVRRNLLSSLLISGGVIALLAMLVGLWLLRRALSPLAGLAAQAREIDPAHPDMASYRGPNDEVGAVAQALNDALASIRTRQEDERASLAEIAHELAAPLTLVAGHLHSLADDYADTRLTTAHEAAQELLYTSQDLLTLARGELERPLELKIFDLVTVLRHIVREYPSISLDVPGVLEVAGSPERLTQLVRNLVRNAVQASGSAEQVTLCLREAGETVNLEVRDSGAGIAPEDLPHLFERFYTRRGGVGVGLSVARRIARQHGGNITVRSAPGETCFTVSLPSLEAQLDDSEEREEWKVKSNEQ